MPTAKAKTLTFDPALTYRVEVESVARVGGMTIRPKQGATIRGDLAEQIRDVITAFEPVE